MEWGLDTKKIKYKILFPKSLKENSSIVKWLDRLEQNTLLRLLESLTSRGVRLILKRIFKGTDLTSISPHHLRHSLCKNLTNSGVNIEQVAMLVGHAKLETTRIYCTLSFSDLIKATNRISEEE